MSPNDDPKKDIKGKGRENPFEELKTCPSAQLHANAQGPNIRMLTSLHDFSSLPARPTPDVTNGTIQWLNNIQEPNAAVTDPLRTHEIHRTISAPGAGNSGTLRSDLVKIGEGIYRTVLKPRIYISSNTPPPWEEDNTRVRSHSTPDANVQRMITKPWSEISRSILRYPLFSNPPEILSKSSSGHQGPVLGNLCPDPSNEFQPYSLFGYHSDGAANGHEPSLYDYLHPAEKTNSIDNLEPNISNLPRVAGPSSTDKATGTISEAKTNSHCIPQDRSRSHRNQPSPLSMVHAVEDASLTSHQTVPNAAGDDHTQAQTAPQVSQNPGLPVILALEDRRPSIELYIMPNAANLMPNISQVLQQSTHQLLVEPYSGMHQSYQIVAQDAQPGLYQPILPQSTSNNGRSVAQDNPCKENFMPPIFESLPNRGRRHSPHASTVIWREHPKSRWQRFWHKIRYLRRDCLCSLPARDASEYELENHEANLHTSHFEHQQRPPRDHYITRGIDREFAQNPLPPRRNSPNKEADASQEPGILGNEGSHTGADADAASDARTLVSRMSFVQKLKGKIRIAVEKRIADRSAKIERRRTQNANQSDQTRTQQEEALDHTEQSQSLDTSKEEINTTRVLTD